MGQKTGFKKGALLLSASLVLSTILGACSTDKAGSGTAAGGTDEITIMLPNFEAENPPENSPVIQKLEELTKVDVNLQWVPSSSYEDKFNITLASGKLPQIMVVLGKSPSFINAARTGAFWELGPYLKDYPILSQLNEIITNNASIDGKTYGIYRARALGRNGVTIRKDWLE
ncbi:extracellular solute-binding protein, partial [Bacillus velezensis]|uniref:extracellular solute-binding protein n=1 Tax=Bacillus velezensis TaxID=492670 RepID=UPI0033986E1F